jgi:hypothetical protein
MFEEYRKREESEREYDRETALKWQDLALTQLGYVINLFLTFGVGIVAYLSKEVLEHPPGFSMPGTRGFRWGVWNRGNVGGGWNLSKCNKNGRLSLHAGTGTREVGGARF